MKLSGGDATDTALCTALKHEFLRCDDAFNDFAASATIMITQGENRRIAFKTYNAYARFIQYLYEFMLGAIKRERGDTELRWQMADSYIASHAQRILSNKREAILKGSAPSWENDISYYPERIPNDFAQKFRRFRNKASTHVDCERSSLSLTTFYDEYHKYLGLLYRDAKNHWGYLEDEFPDLKEITAFSVLIKHTLPSKP